MFKALLIGIFLTFIVLPAFSESQPWLQGREWLQGAVVDQNAPRHIFIGYDSISKKQWRKIKDAFEKNQVHTIENLKAMKQIRANRTMLIYLKGMHDENDGGEGYFLARKSSDQVDSALVVPAVDGAFIYERIHNGWVSFKWFGAKGDGVINDTLAIQRALDTRFNAYASGAKKVFLVGEKGDQAALRIYSHQKINLNGATMKLRDYCNCSIIANQAFLKEQLLADENIVIENGILDGNVKHQKLTGITNKDIFSPAIYLGNIHKSILRNLVVKNYYAAGIYFAMRKRQSIEDNQLLNITVDTGYGPGIVLNGNSFFGDNLKIYNAEKFTENGKDRDYWGAYANSMTMYVEDSTFGLIQYRNCRRGLKVQDGSKNVAIKKVEASQVLDDYAVKVQGIKHDKDKYSYNQNIRIDEIISQNNAFSGLYIIYSDGVYIGSYRGVNNGSQYGKRLAPNYFNKANFYDVYVLWANVRIGLLVSVDANQGVLYSRDMFSRKNNQRIFDTIQVIGLKQGHVAYLHGANHRIGSISIEGDQPLDCSVVYVAGDSDKDNNIAFIGSVSSTVNMKKNTAPFGTVGGKPYHGFVVERFSVKEKPLRKFENNHLRETDG